MFRKLILAEAVCALVSHVPAALAAEDVYSLARLREMAQATHPVLQAAQAQVDAGRGQVQAASAYPNPELEFQTGKTRPRTSGVTTGSVTSLAVTQRLDLPWQREARIGAASAGLEALEAERRGFEVDWLAALNRAWFDLLRREAEQRATQEDLDLADQIHAKVAVRVKTGESPRYELIKADTERLNARKNRDAAVLRVAQARAALRARVGGALPEDFRIVGSLRDVTAPPALEELQAEVLARNPELLEARARVRQAEQQLALERLRRQPEVSLKLSQEQDPEIRDSRAGLVLTVPLWDRRQGPVAEAGAQLQRSLSLRDARQLALQQALTGAYSQYEQARNQVNALENGILREAEAALKVAEAAYRFGERGILDYLDAQRVFRAARNELITARHELQLATIEIERLRALP